MARNRQRAKERQARRKAQQGGSAESPERISEPAARISGIEPEPVEPEPVDPPAEPVDPERSSYLDVEDEDPFGEADEHYDPAEDEPEDGSGELTGKRVEAAGTAKGGPRFVQFLRASWAELQRVQWPDRQALTTLTGVVLGFVVLAGGYLGLLDAVFSRVVQAIL